MNDIFLWIAQLIERFGGVIYVFLFLAMFLESTPIIGLFLPGATIMIIAGVFAASGSLDTTTVIIVGSVGAFVGDLVAYYIGRRFSRSFAKEHRFLKREYLTRAEAFSKRWGASSVFLGRFLGPLRAMVSVVAGMTALRFSLFAILTIIGSSLFVSLHVLLGYLAGSAWQTIEAWSSRAGLVLLTAIVAAATLWWLKGFFVRQGRDLRNIFATLIKDGVRLWMNTRMWQRFKRRFVRTALILERRLAPDHFHGLPLVSMFILIAICFVLCFWIGFAALDAMSFWANFDERIRSVAALFSDTRLAIAAFFITVLGSTTFVTVAATIGSFWLFLENRRSHIMGLWTVILGTVATGTAVKMFFARPRPDPTFYFENFYAFPSLHAALAFAFLLYFAYYAIRAYPRWTRSVSLVFAVSIMVFLVGLSRIYLGVHYPTDVLGGYTLGAAWCLIGIIVQRYFERGESARRLSRFFKISMISAATLILGVVYINQTFDKGIIKDFYSSLPIRIERQTSVSLDERVNWPLSTENLRGGRSRPISALIISDTEALQQALLLSGWNERVTPTLRTVIESWINRLLKKENADAPLRPRFWHNRPNELVFTKIAPRDELSDAYVLRLWKTQLIEGTPAFVAEISINRDFSFDLPPSADELIRVGLEQFISDLTKQPFFKGLEQRTFRSFDGDDTQETITTIYVISL